MLSSILQYYKQQISLISADSPKFPFPQALWYLHPVSVKSNARRPCTKHLYLLLILSDGWLKLICWDKTAIITQKKNEIWFPKGKLCASRTRWDPDFITNLCWGLIISLFSQNKSLGFIRCLLNFHGLKSQYKANKMMHASDSLTM